MAIIQPLTGKGTSTTQTSSSGYSSIIQPLTSKPTNNPGYVAPKTSIKTVQAPPQGFKIGDVISTVEKTASNIQKTAQDFIIKNLPQTVNQAEQLAQNPKNTGKSIQNIASDMWNTIKTPVMDYFKANQDQYNAGGSILHPISPAKDIGIQARKTAAELNTFFSPISALYTAASDTPVVGSLVKFLTLPFTAASEASVRASNKAIDQLPISKRAKDQLKPGIGDLVALASQLALGKIVDIPAEKTGELINKYGVNDAMVIEAQAKKLAQTKANEIKPGEQDPQKVIDHIVNNKLQDTPEGQQALKTAVEAQKAGSNVTIKFPEPTPIEGAKIVPINKIETGLSDYINKNANTATPKIQKYEQVLRDGGTLEPIPVYEKNGGYVLNKDGFHRLQAYKNIGRENVSVRVEPETTLSASAKQRAENAPILQPSMLGLRVDQTSIEKGLGELQSIPGYEKMNMKEQAQRASDLINSDPQKAYDIALGKAEAPKGLTAESVFKAVEKSITKPEQAIELANSPLVSEASKLGQRIKSLDVKTSESPIEAIKQVMDARRKTIQTTLGKTIEKATTDTIKQIKESIKKASPTKQDWASFIKEIQC